MAHFRDDSSGLFSPNPHLWSRIWYAGVFLILTTAVIGEVPNLALADQYEAPLPRQASALLPPDLSKGEYYQIEPEVGLAGYMNIYRVKSRFGAFTVRGDLMLRRLLREIGAIAKLKQISRTKAFGKSLGESALEPLEAGAKLVKQPFQALKGIPLGIHRLLTSGAKSMTRKRTDYEDGDFAALLAVSAYKRDFAADLGVDVYSSNPVLQKELERVAWASVPGYLALSAALMPVKGVAGKSAKGLATVDFLNDVLEEKAPADLHLLNEKRLETIGIEPALISHFLNHPVLSPRHQTVITACLVDLGEVSGREIVLQTSLNALSEEEAFFFQQIAELMRAYHLQETPIIEIRRFRRLPVGIDREEFLFLPLPFDYGIWTREAERFFDELVQTLSVEVGRAKLWITGKLSNRAAKNLKQRHFQTSERMQDQITLMD